MRLHSCVVIILIAMSIIPSLTYPQWVQTNGPYGGLILSVAARGTVVLAASSGMGGRLYRSMDNGENWNPIFISLGDPLSLTVEGTYFLAGTDNGVLRSTDDGASWNVVGLQGQYVHTVAYLNGRLYAGTRTGAFRSRDDGVSWTAINDGLTNTDVYTFTLGGTYLYCGTEGGVFRSWDEGENWEPCNYGLTNPSIRALMFSGNNLDLFAATYYGPFFHSTDWGTSWIEINRLSSFAVTSIAVKDGSVFVGTACCGVWRSTDNGESWEGASWYGLSYNGVYALAVSGTNLFAGTLYGGVFRSTDDGASYWTAANRGMMDAEVRALAVVGQDFLAGTHGNGLFRSTDKGESWTADPLLGAYNYINAFALSSTSLFAGTQHYVYRSTDNAISWTLLNNGLTMPVVTSLAVNSSTIFAGTWDGVFHSPDDGENWTTAGLQGQMVHAVALNGGNLFAGIDGGVFRSMDNGVHWTAVNKGLTNLSVHVLTVNGTHLFAGTWGGGVFRTTDNGDNWTDANAGMTSTWANAFLVHGANLFVGTEGGGVFRTTDNGDNWTDANTGLTKMLVRSLAVGSTELLAGILGSGIWKRPLSDFGVSPARQIANILTFFDQSVAAGTLLGSGKGNSADGRLKALRNMLKTSSDLITRGRIADACQPLLDAYERTDRLSRPPDFVAGESAADLAEMIADLRLILGCNGVAKQAVSGTFAVQIPSTFNLIQNYPNPFNPSTTIKFDLPKSSEVRLSVFDMLGREVSVLVNEKKEVGYHEVQFDGSKLASGVYLYRMVAGSYVETRKLLLVR